MDSKTVKDLMVPLDQYAVVPESATVLDAIRVLKLVRVQTSPDRHLPRAVVVIDKHEVVVGQIGHLDFLGALEPAYPPKGDIDVLTRAGVDDSLLDSVVQSQRFWQSNLDDACRRVRGIKVTEIMHPVTDSIDEMASIWDAIRKIVKLGAMRMLVLSGGDVVGIVRLADLFAEIADCIESIEE
jgi:CBS domain-containing protein